MPRPRRSGRLPRLRDNGVNGTWFQTPSVASQALKNNSPRRHGEHRDCSSVLRDLRVSVVIFITSAFIAESSIDKIPKSFCCFPTAASADQGDAQGLQAEPSSLFPDQWATSPCDRRPSPGPHSARYAASRAAPSRDKEISAPRVDRRKANRPVGPRADHD